MKKLKNAFDSLGIWRGNQKGKHRRNVMKSTFSKLTLAAGFALALAFTVSCSKKCGENKYDQEKQFCYNNSEVKEKCSGEVYNPETQFCGGSDIVEKCGDKEYNLATQFCYNNKDVANKCNGKEYNAETQFCGVGEILDKCGGKEYNAEAQFCDSRDSKIYKYIKVDTLIWMAENLNYDAKGSKCYGNKSDNCDKYGKLYNWVTVMAFPSSCSSNFCSSKVQKKHTGICPSGWHIPAAIEWSNLERSVGGEYKFECEPETSNCVSFSTAGGFLKSKNGWNKNGNGTDDFGFAALPSGNGTSAGFKYAGEIGFWWSATEDDDEMNGGPEYVNYRSMSQHSNNVGNSSHYKTSMFSVRCVKD